MDPVLVLKVDGRERGEVRTFEHAKERDGNVGNSEE